MLTQRWLRALDSHFGAMAQIPRTRWSKPVTTVEAVLLDPMRILVTEHKGNDSDYVILSVESGQLEVEWADLGRRKGADRGLTGMALAVVAQLAEPAMVRPSHMYKIFPGLARARTVLEDRRSEAQRPLVTSCLLVTRALASAAAGGPDRVPEWWRIVLQPAKGREQEEAYRQGVDELFITPISYYYGADAKGALSTSLLGLVGGQSWAETLGLFWRRVRPRIREMALIPPPPGLIHLVGTPEFREIERAAARQRVLLALNTFNSQEDAVKNKEVISTQLDVDLAMIPSHRGLKWLRMGLWQTMKSGERRIRSYNQAYSLSVEVQEGKRHLGAHHGWMKDWLKIQFGYQTNDSRTDFSPDRLFDLWSRFGAHNILTWRDGGENVVLKSAPARLDCDIINGERLQWVYRLDEGASVPVSKADLSRADTIDEVIESELALRVGNALYRVDHRGMPWIVVERLRDCDTLSGDEILQAGLGYTILNWLTPDSAAKSLLTRTVAVKASAGFVLRGKTLRVRVTANGPDETIFLMRGNGTWRVADRKATAGVSELSQFALPGDELLHLPEVSEAELAHQGMVLAVQPRLEDVNPVTEWIRPVVVNASPVADEDGTVWLEVNLKGRGDEMLMELWSTRPERVEYLGNEAFRRVVELRRPPRFNLNWSSTGIDWLKVSVEMENETEKLSLREVEEVLKASAGRLVRLSGNRVYTREELEEWSTSVRGMMEMGISPRAGEQRVHALQALASREESVATITAPIRRQLAQFQGVPEQKKPKGLKADLRPYQRDGVSFLVWACGTFGGALLCDDMGLGKTLQTIAALLALRAAAKEPGPTLVVCPASVVDNWRREITRFAPQLRCVIAGSGPDRFEIYKKLGEVDVLITNYALARIDAEPLTAQQWFLICADESQAIKNPQAVTTLTLKQLEAKHRIALTGTPVENRLSDLWSIADFALPGYLGDEQHFAEEYAVEGAERMLRARLRPVLLRRLKAEVAPELPPRIEERLDCEMSPGQRTAYVAEVKLTRMMMEAAAARDKRTGEDAIQMLAALTRLRLICCHPALRGLPGESGKLEELIPLVQEIMSEGHKVLIFSQFVEMIKLIEARLKTESIPTHKLTGSTTNRGAVVADFEADTRPCAFLISLKAGGTGLNLTSATHVVLFDPWWNPAVEAQAIDRTHRIGQDKTVVAVRLITKGTVEERIAELQEKKRALVQGVFEEEAFAKSLTQEDIRFLLG